MKSSLAIGPVPVLVALLLLVGPAGSVCAEKGRQPPIVEERGQPSTAEAVGDWHPFFEATTLRMDLVRAGNAEGHVWAIERMIAFTAGLKELPPPDRAEKTP